jgi:undecaprenyl-diphosphatase
MFSDQRFEKRILKYVSARAWAKYLAIFCARYLLFIELGWLLLAIWQQHSLVQFFGLVCALVFTELATDLLQQTVRRDRPYQKGLPSLIKPWIKTPSFPSGHASLSLAMAVFAFTVSPEVGITALLMALFVTLSRVAVGVHYLSDILSGALLGIIVALMVIFAQLGDFVFNLIT